MTGWKQEESMPIDLVYNEESQILIAEIKGHVDFNDFLLVAPKITDDTRFSSNVNMIWDVRQMDLKSFTTEFAAQLLKLRSQLADKRTGSRLAIVANSDFTYGMSRMYQGMSEGDFKQSLNVFRDSVQAEEWINNSSSDGTS
jgi:hypothetical protein